MRRGARPLPPKALCFLPVPGTEDRPMEPTAFGVGGGIGVEKKIGIDPDTDTDPDPDEGGRRP